MIRIPVLATLALVLILGGTTAAHHSFGAYYFEDQSVTIEGDVVAFDYKAPHAWVHVNAPDERGEMQKYSAEWANPTRLARDNITKDTIKRGDHVVVTGSPGRTASEHKLHLKRIERAADGWKWAGPRRR